MTSDFIILGVGGHALVLVDALGLLGERPSRCLAPDAPGADWPVDIPYAGTDDMLSLLDPKSVELINGVGSVGSTSVRRSVFDRATSLGFTLRYVFHPSAVLSAAVRFGMGAQVMAGAIVQRGVNVGDNVLVNTGAIIDHDCDVGPHVHVATGARLCGGVRVGTGAHIGAGATVLQGVKIGEGAIVGAGAIVLADVAAASTVVGNPARAISKGTGRA